MSRLGVITAAVALVALAISIGNLLITPKSPSPAGRFQLFQGEFDRRWEDPASGLAADMKSLIGVGIEKEKAAILVTDAYKKRSEGTRVRSLFRVDTVTGETWILASSVKAKGGIRQKWESTERGLDDK